MPLVVAKQFLWDDENTDKPARASRRAQAEGA
jgi:hypothetical protein